jgi:hypothetical protein
MPKVEQVRINLEYLIKRDELILAKAKSSHAFVDKSGKVVRPPRDFTVRTSG